MTWPGGRKLEIFDSKSSIFPQKNQDNKMEIDAPWQEVVEK
jgi:hypothetical protein